MCVCVREREREERECVFCVYLCVIWCEDDAVTARRDARRDARRVHARRWEGKGGLPIQAGGCVVDFKRLFAAVDIPISMLNYLN